MLLPLIVLAILVGAVAGLFFMLYYYGLRGAGLFRFGINLMIILPVVIVRGVKHFAKQIECPTRRSRFIYKTRLAFTFIAVMPIAINDFLNDLAPVANEKHPEKTSAKTRQSLARELSVAAAAYVVVT